MDKNQQIAETYKATMLRRQNQICKVFEFKVKKHMLNKLQQEQLKMIFVEAKWFYNYLLNLSNENKINLFNIDSKIQTITHYNKNNQIVNYTLNYLSASMKQTIIKDMCNSIRSLARSKRNNHKIGILQFKSEYKSINLKQYGITHKLVLKNRIKIQGVKKPLPISGLKQLNKFDNIEYANAHLIQKCNDYYIQLTVLLNKEEKLKSYKNKQLGIDFGCQTNFVLSDGSSYHTYIEETDHLKQLSKKLKRQKKGSNNYYKTRIKIQKEYQKLNNLKNEYVNQLVHKLLSENEQIIIQDEQINSWKKKHGKKIQHSILGKVKSKLLIHRNQVTVLNKFVPTTKLCTNCGHIHQNIKLYDRKFICPNCKAEEDRDLHAAKNMIWIYNNMIGVDGTEFKHTDFEKQLKAIFSRIEV